MGWSGFVRYRSIYCNETIVAYDRMSYVLMATMLIINDKIDNRKSLTSWTKAISCSFIHHVLSIMKFYMYHLIFRISFQACWLHLFLRSLSNMFVLWKLGGHAIEGKEKIKITKLSEIYHIFLHFSLKSSTRKVKSPCFY